VRGATALGLVLVAALGGAVPARAGDPALVDVRTYARGIQVDVRYATPNNFTGAPLPGYCKPRALLLPGAARRLARVQRGLRGRGLGLKVFDAYRPARASRAMVRWARRTNREWLLTQGYIARRSNHNLGTTVDLTLVTRRTGEELDMGTAFDAFTPRSTTTRARGRVLRNRLTLKNAMEGHGFVNYRREWWHYDSAEPGPRRLDVPIGC
jgi:D-alanyl-D-alanine dipeptidase